MNWQLSKKTVDKEIDSLKEDELSDEKEPKSKVFSLIKAFEAKSKAQDEKPILFSKKSCSSNDSDILSVSDRSESTYESEVGFINRSNSSAFESYSSTPVSELTLNSSPIMFSHTDYKRECLFRKKALIQEVIPSVELPILNKLPSVN